MSEAEEITGTVEMTEAQGAPVADPIVLTAREEARAALAEITSADSIGAEAGHEVEGDHVVTLFFDCTLAGYPGWRWAATLARVDEDSPVNVLEVELLPGPDAVVAPEWVPWSVRMAQYRETQARQAADELTDAEAAAAELSDEDDVEGDEDLLTNDFSDFDDDLDGADLDDDDDDDYDGDDYEEDSDLDEESDLDLSEDEGEDGDDTEEE